MSVSPDLNIAEVLYESGSVRFRFYDADGKLIGRHRSTGIGRPRFWDRARYYGEEKRLAAALDAAEVVAPN